jgi:glycosyltransferase involved in cell wall biosynthesis
MRIFFDHQCYWETFGGVSRYFTEILKTEASNVQYELALKYSNNEYLKELNFPVKPFLKNWNIPKKHYLISAINKPHTIKLYKETNPEIVHLTHYDPYLLKYIKKSIVVSTIHDLNYFAVPQFFREKPLLKRWQSEVSKRSDILITISENSKRDLMEYLNIPEEKISVIYHGINNDFRRDINPRIISKPYILFVGRRIRYKNFDIVFKAFLNIKNRYKDLCLVCTNPSFSKEERKLFQENNISDRIISFPASENQLVNLYSHAIAFIFPSFYEGFGFPLLEAMGCECPIICSKASCFPEIAGGAAIYFNPYSEEELTEKLCELIESSDLQNKLKRTGLIQKNKYSWNISRQKHIELYKKISI